MLHQVLFFTFGTICIAGAINLLAQRHPIHSALSLIVVMASLAVLFLLLGAEFVAAIQVIVYAGAIMVLFVFVIMLLNAGIEETSEHSSRVALVFGIPGLLLLSTLIAWVLLRREPVAAALPSGSVFGGAKDVARLLFHDFLLPFEVTSILILIGIMGAVVLTRRGD
jgi:NADH-quinone oxidoreductase subunit J